MVSVRDNTKTRMTTNHIKLAFVNFNDNVVEQREEQLEFGEWNTEEEGDEENDME